MTDPRHDTDDHEPGEVTLDAYLDAWLQRQRTQVRRATSRFYDAIARRQLRPALGATPLRALTPMSLTHAFHDMALHGGLDGQPVSLDSVRKAHALLRQVLGDAVDDGLLTRNPAELAIIPRRHPAPPEPTRTTPTVWTAEQLVTFLAATADRPLADLWVLAACTGMRRGELLALSWDDVDLHHRTIRVAWSLSVLHGRIERDTTKSARPRTIGFDDRAAAALQRQRRRQHDWQAERGPTWHNAWNLVFTQPDGTPLLPDGVSTTFAREVARLDLPHATIHTLRHVHATLLLQAGITVKVVSQRLGHATARHTLDTYTHVLPAIDRAAVDQLTTLLDGKTREAET
jgi:integrase